MLFRSINDVVRDIQWIPSLPQSLALITDDDRFLITELDLRRPLNTVHIATGITTIAISDNDIYMLASDGTLTSFELK